MKEEIKKKVIEQNGDQRGMVIIMLVEALDRFVENFYGAEINGIKKITKQNIAEYLGIPVANLYSSLNGSQRAKWEHIQLLSEFMAQMVDLFPDFKIWYIDKFMQMCNVQKYSIKFEDGTVIKG